MTAKQWQGMWQLVFLISTCWWVGHLTSWQWGLAAAGFLLYLDQMLAVHAKA